MGKLIAAFVLLAGCAPCVAPGTLDAGASPDAPEASDGSVEREGCAAFDAVDVIPADLEWLRAHTMPRVHGCELHPLQREAPAALLESFAPALIEVSECAPLWRVRDELAACIVAWEGR